MSALATFDAGGGEALYAGGRFDSIGGVEVNGIARWDGAQWTRVGEFRTGPWEGGIAALSVWNKSLIAGGRFDRADGIPVHNVARWDPGAPGWSALGFGQPCQPVSTSTGTAGGVFGVATSAGRGSLWVAGAIVAVPHSTISWGLTMWNGAWSSPIPAFHYQEAPSVLASWDRGGSASILWAVPFPQSVALQPATSPSGANARARSNVTAMAG